jgi:transposase
LTGGEAHDCPVAKRLIRRVKSPKRMLGDKAYDSAELHEELDERGTKPVIPNRCNRKQPFSFSKRLYKLRWRIESAFNRLKGLQAHCNTIRQVGAKLLVFRLPSCQPYMVDLMSLDPSRAIRNNGLRPQASAFATTSIAIGTITICAATMQADMRLVPKFLF